MSMNVLTIIQVTGILASYLLMTLVLPAMLLYKKIKHLRFCERFMAYQMAGNFYMMNLVSILELLHISNRVTLILFTVFPCIIIYIRIYKKDPVQMTHDAFDYLERLAGGQFGVKLFMRRVRLALWKVIKKALRTVFLRIGMNFIDILLVAVLTAGVLYIYGTNLLNYYGFGESDLPVHHYWINYLGQNKMFVAGVYPFGFHCVVYFLHEVFAIPTYVLLRVFCIVQNLMIHYMLLAFVKYCCKSKFAPYVGVFAYVFLGIFGENTYIRYFSTLPQEFGMLFILPSIYYLFAFFEKKKRKNKEAGEDKGEKKKKKNGEIDDGKVIRLEEAIKLGKEIDSEDIIAAAKEAAAEEIDDGKVIRLDEVIGTKRVIEAEPGKKAKKAKKKKREKKKRTERTEDFWYLAGFAISFGMTLSAHFYDTMIAGLLCIGVAGGYFFRMFKPWYLKKVILTGIISMAIALFPMVVAFLMGTPLQGSLGWGMKVISGDNAKNTVTTVQNNNAGNDGNGQQGNNGSNGQQGGSTEGNVNNGQQAGNVNDGQQGVNGEVTAGSGQQGDVGLDVEAGNTQTAPKVSFVQRIISKLKGAVAAFWDAMKIYIILDTYPLFQMLLICCMPVLALLSLLFFAVRQTDYAARCLSLSIGLVMLAILQASSRLGLPTLMDAIRTCIFFAYVVVAAWSLCVDAVLQFIFGWFKRKWILHTFSLAVLALIAFYCSEQEEWIRTPPERQSLQTNDAILCLTNILRDNEDFTWTICSANDELRMGEDYGYHHEVHTFLKDLEKRQAYSNIVIPTKKVYFFIEKVPVIYARAYRGTEPKVSDEMAKEPLPAGRGITMYQGVNRLIEMSKMYRWAKDFEKLYPNEMSVYYESDNFVCYCVEQDLYRPFNFAIQSYQEQ